MSQQPGQQIIPPPTLPMANAAAAVQPTAPPVAPAAPAAPSPLVPFTVFVVDGTVQGGIPLAVVSANIKVVRSGAMPTLGSVEVRSILAGQTEQMSLMALASKPGPYTLMIRYTGPDGIVIREDAILIAEGSRAEYTGPEISKDGDSWEFIETLVIHPA